jgi:BON domain
MKRFGTLAASILLAALATGCSDTANSNNGNTAARNANTTNRNAAGNSSATNDNKRAGEQTREEYEKNKETLAKQAKDLGSKIGSGAEDLWLWTKTRTELAGVGDLRDSTINVDVDNGVVTLRGTVASQDQVQKAEATAKGVEGVKSVRNELKVSAPTGNSNSNSNAANSNTKARK